jgi:hypothetical protein
MSRGTDAYLKQLGLRHLDELLCNIEVSRVGLS